MSYPPFPPRGMPPFMPRHGGPPPQKFGGFPPPQMTPYPGPGHFGGSTISCPPMARPPPITTCFIGNIPEKVTNDLMILILQEVGDVSNWKRVIGANGKYQGFGFCEFNSPTSTVRSLRCLHDYKIADKKLVVKTRGVIRDWLKENRSENGDYSTNHMSVGNGAAGDLESSKQDREDDPRYLQAIECLIKRSNPELIAVDAEEGEIDQMPEEVPHLEGKGGSIDFEDLDPSQKRQIASEISKFREKTKDATELDYIADKDNLEERKKMREKVERDRKDTEERDRKRKEQPAAFRIKDSDEESSDGEGGKKVREVKEVKKEKSVGRERDSQKEKRSRSASRKASPSTSVHSNSVRDRERDRDRERRREHRPEASRERERDRDNRDNRERDRERYKRRESRDRPDRPPYPYRADVNKSRAPIQREKATSRERQVHSPETEERIEMEKKLAVKEKEYKTRLSRWELREEVKGQDHKKFKKHMQSELKEQQREAKKMLQFLSRYEDEVDDDKYYRGGQMSQRKWEYERERKLDESDRRREEEEMRELKKKLKLEGVEPEDLEKEMRVILKQEQMKYGKRRKELESPPPEDTKRKLERKREQLIKETEKSPTANGRTSGERKRKISRPSSESSTGDSSSDSQSESADDTENKPGIKRQHKPIAEPSPLTSIPLSNGASPLDVKPKLGFSGLKLSSQNKSASSLNGVFDTEEDDSSNQNTRRKAPLTKIELTDEERLSLMTPEEKKKMIKLMIDKIPTDKQSLFKHPIDWTHVDQSLIDVRIKPWVNKKIIEYIGEEEPSLVEFVISKINQNTSPQNVMEDIRMVLDDEAEVFVVKMWRLIIYEIEAKRLGLVKYD